MVIIIYLLGSFYLDQSQIKIKCSFITVYGKSFKEENFRGYKTKPPFAGKASHFTDSPIRDTIDTKIYGWKTFADGQKTVKVSP